MCSKIRQFCVLNLSMVFYIVIFNIFYCSRKKVYQTVSLKIGRQLYIILCRFTVKVGGDLSHSYPVPADRHPRRYTVK